MFCWYIAIGIATLTAIAANALGGNACQFTAYGLNRIMIGKMIG